MELFKKKGKDPDEAFDQGKSCEIRCPQCGFSIYEISSFRCPRCFAEIIPSCRNCKGCSVL